MGKQNVLVLNRMNRYHYYNKENEMHIDKEKYNVYLFTVKNKANQFKPEDYVEMFSLDTNDDERVFQLAKEIHNEVKIHKVVALAEKNIEVAARIREMAGAEGYLPKFVKKVRDKYIMKEVLREKGIRVPYFESFESKSQVTSLLNEYQKIVIKPKNGMGSENTYIISNNDELNFCLSNISIKALDYEVEEYITGEMYHIDSVIEDTNIKLASVSKYMNSTLGYTNEESFLASYMIGDSPLKRRLENFNKLVIEGLEIDTGVTHLEVFVTPEEEIVFCEIGARAGGAGVMPCIEEAFNLNLFHAHIKSELGESMPPVTPTEKIAGWIIFYGEQGVINKLPSMNLFNKDWIPTNRIFVSEGDRIKKARYSTDSIASFIITASNEQELLSRIKWVQGQFNVEYIIDEE
ncbi:ATP-grasp domain-containing protein [Bacillus infantis]|uniref:ATP-grasp domain-containing protein n=1 Tax=Bacillus infantis TaxID=324767 RepID=UPI00209E1BB2|nr:ATP-grasp domain-containing protein [Bacillus infantis]MCP1161334.1 ATP-grasp domain-containing protein [Bacillus infantis]